MVLSAIRGIAQLASNKAFNSTSTPPLRSGASAS